MNIAKFFQSQHGSPCKVLAACSAQLAAWYLDRRLAIRSALTGEGNSLLVVPLPSMAFSDLVTSHTVSATVDFSSQEVRESLGLDGPIPTTYDSELVVPCKVIVAGVETTVHVYAQDLLEALNSMSGESGTYGAIYTYLSDKQATNEHVDLSALKGHIEALTGELTSVGVSVIEELTSSATTVQEAYQFLTSRFSNALDALGGLPDPDTLIFTTDEYDTESGVLCGLNYVGDTLSRLYKDAIAGLKKATTLIGTITNVVIAGISALVNLIAPGAFNRTAVDPKLPNGLTNFPVWQTQITFPSESFDTALTTLYGWLVRTRDGNKGTRYSLYSKPASFAFITADDGVNRPEPLSAAFSVADHKLVEHSTLTIYTPFGVFFIQRASGYNLIISLYPNLRAADMPQANVDEYYGVLTSAGDDSSYVLDGKYVARYTSFDTSSDQSLLFGDLSGSNLYGAYVDGLANDRTTSILSAVLSTLVRSTGYSLPYSVTSKGFDPMALLPHVPVYGFDYSTSVSGAPGAKMWDDTLFETAAAAYASRSVLSSPLYSDLNSMFLTRDTSAVDMLAILSTHHMYDSHYVLSDPDDGPDLLYSMWVSSDEWDYIGAMLLYDLFWRVIFTFSPPDRDLGDTLELRWVKPESSELSVMQKSPTSPADKLALSADFNPYSVAPPPSPEVKVKTDDDVGKVFATLLAAAILAAAATAAVKAVPKLKAKVRLRAQRIAGEKRAFENDLASYTPEQLKSRFVLNRAKQLRRQEKLNSLVSRILGVGTSGVISGSVSQLGLTDNLEDSIAGVGNLISPDTP